MNSPHFAGGIRLLTREIWDRQFESDVKAGRLDALADEALRAHTSGQSKQL